MHGYSDFDVIDTRGRRIEGHDFAGKYAIYEYAADKSGFPHKEYRLSEKDMDILCSRICFDDFLKFMRNNDLDRFRQLLHECRTHPLITYYDYEYKFNKFGNGTFRWTFYEDDSKWNGDDFEYRLSLTRKMPGN